MVVARHVERLHIKHPWNDERAGQPGKDAVRGADGRRQPGFGSAQIHYARPGEALGRIDADQNAEKRGQQRRIGPGQDADAEPDADAHRRQQRPQAAQAGKQRAPRQRLPQIGREGGEQQQGHRLMKAQRRRQQRKGYGRQTHSNHALDGAGHEKCQADDDEALRFPHLAPLRHTSDVPACAPSVAAGNVSASRRSVPFGAGRAPPAVEIRLTAGAKSGH